MFRIHIFTKEKNALFNITLLLNDLEHHHSEIKLAINNLGLNSCTIYISQDFDYILYIRLT